MIQTRNLDIPMWSASAFRDCIRVGGVDLRTATLAMQGRLYRDAPGDPLFSLGMADPEDEGLSVTFEVIGGKPTSYVWIHLLAATIVDVLPFTVVSGVANRKANVGVSMWHDITVQTDTSDHPWWAGQIHINPQVTRP